MGTPFLGHGGSRHTNNKSSWFLLHAKAKHARRAPVSATRAQKHAAAIARAQRRRKRRHAAAVCVLAPDHAAMTARAIHAVARRRRDAAVLHANAKVRVVTAVRVTRADASLRVHAHVAGSARVRNARVAALQRVTAIAIVGPIVHLAVTHVGAEALVGPIVNAAAIVPIKSKHR